MCCSSLMGQSLQVTLDHLYSDMPLVDRVTYSREFFTTQVKASLKARAVVPWGQEVSEREFRYFVVPVRVNNEPLDEHREVFQKELLPRVQGLSAKEAILEVNHWCHEKASYQPSDGRTHSPLQTVSSAIGRCGEESTLAVAALRSVCIPARQVYTPRWAHTDDNHAWVEAWADGQWWFLGACEPEAVLNLGWFNEPASRGMLMNTSVPGAYDGPEEVLSKANGVTTINVTANYAAVDTLRVRISDRCGRPLEGLSVSFRLYNYAEYYPLATFTTDSAGEASMVAGLGDLLVWVSDGEHFCFKKASVGRDRLVDIVWTGKSTMGDFDFDLVPPKASNSKPQVSDSEARVNVQRLSQEDIIRTAYTVGAFFDPTKITEFAPLVGLDSERLCAVLVGAKAHWQSLYQWLRQLSEDSRDVGLSLLESLSDKDLTDVSVDVLTDALRWTEPQPLEDIFIKYILCQRVSNEELTPYREYFCGRYSPEQRAAFRSDPCLWEREVSSEIETTESWHPSTFHMGPREVGQSKKTDRASRDIYFVAGARSFGIPARVDPITGKVQWLGGEGLWVDAFAKSVQARRMTGRLMIKAGAPGGPAKPKYYSHFSISRIEGGVPHQLEFDEGASISDIFGGGPIDLDAGTYMLTTGQRLSDGSVLSHNTIFSLKTGGSTTLELKFRNDPSKLSVIGSLDAESLYYDLASGVEKSILSTTGRGFYVLGIVRSGHEPSTHAIKDIEAAREQLEAWGGSVLLLFEQASDAQKFELASYALPSNVSLGVDRDGKIAAQILQSLGKPDTEEELPIFVIADSFNRIVYFSSGYTIGLGGRLSDLLGRL